MAIRAGIGAGVALALAMATGLATPAAAADAGRVVASVNGTDITLGHIAVLRSQLPPQYQQLPDDILFRGLLEQVIQQTALAQSMDGRTSARDEIAMENERRAYLAGAALQQLVTEAVTDAALQAAYEARFADAEPQTEYNAAHILVATEEEAARLRAELDAGADFAELARAHSTDGAAAGGGALGWFGLGMMVKPFEEAVVSLSPGDVGGPIQTQFGWHLIKLSETRIAEAPSLDEIRGELASELEQAAVEAHIAAVTEAATITRNDDGIDPGFLRDQNLFD